MLPPKHRLQKNDDFQRVYRSRQRYSSYNLMLWLRPNKHKEVRIGIAIGKKIGHAPLRHRLKRVIQEALRHNIPFIQKQPYDLIFQTKKQTPHSFNLWQAEREIFFLLKKTNLIQRNVQPQSAAQLYL